MLDGPSALRGRARLTVLVGVAGLTAAIGAGLLWNRQPLGGIASQRPTAKLLRIEGGWAVPSTLPDDVTRALRKEIGRRKRVTLLPSDDQLALRQETGCVAPEPSCLAAAARRAGARLAVYGSVSREQADRYKLELVVLDAQKGAIERRTTDTFGLEVTSEEIGRRAERWAELVGGLP
jgi:hypothetical protein